MFSIVLVTYNSAEIIGEAIKSIPPGNQVIVVDNASRDDSAVRAHNLGAKVVELRENLGFGTACNRGAALATHEQLLFLNPDARLEASALDELSEAFARYPLSAAFNPRFLDEQGKQFFIKRNRFVGRHHWLSQLPQADALVPVAVGAALAIRASVFRRLNGFDENIFLYFEDIDLSARVLNAGYGIHYVHRAVVIHHGGRSSGDSSEVAYLKSYHFAKAKRYTSHKHGLWVGRWWQILKHVVRYAFAYFRGDKAQRSRAEARLKGWWEN